MNREKIITILIGLIVGAAIAGGYFYWTRILPHQQTKSPKTVDKLTQPPRKNEANTKADQSAALTLSSPQDNSSTEQSSITLSGRAPANSRLVVFGNADEKIASASADGSFEISLKLEVGLNVISVTAFEPSGTRHTVQRNVTLEASQ